MFKLFIGNYILLKTKTIYFNDRDTTQKEVVCSWWILNTPHVNLILYTSIQYSNISWMKKAIQSCTYHTMFQKGHLLLVIAQVNHARHIIEIGYSIHCQVNAFNIEMELKQSIQEVQASFKHESEHNCTRSLYRHNHIIHQ